jgi:hypothetical protein
VSDRPDRRWEQSTVDATRGEGGKDDEPSPFDPAAGDRFVERGELGRGGMGRVYEADDTLLDRPVAIKQSLTDDAEMRARFLREVRITARLQHPGIVPVLDAGRDADGRPYYVMRKIDGTPLGDVIAKRSIVERLGLVPDLVAAVDAVAYAHARGVIHRDIKPGNILLGSFGETLVIDWGLARQIDDGGDDARAAPASDPDRDLTRLGSAMGTPGFMAPEQARGEPCDRRGDVFSLGATLYYVLVGASPFGDDPTAAIDRAAADSPPDLDRLPPEAPPELVAILAKAMATAAADRYADAGALAGDLRRFLAGQLVAAHRYTTRELVVRWIRRHRIAVAIAAIAAAIVATTATIAIRRVIAERDRADAARIAATTRADELLVERADAIAATDPTRAAVLIAQLDPQSPAWPRAIPVLHTARSHGVAAGRLAHRAKLGTLSATHVVGSRDGAAMFTFGGDDRTILRHDPALREPPRVVARFDNTLLDLMVLDADTLVAIDREYAAFTVSFDGVVQRLDTGGAVRDPFASRDGRLFAFRRIEGSRGGVVELAPDGGPPRDLGLSPAYDAAYVGDGVVASVGDRIVHRSDAAAVTELHRRPDDPPWPASIVVQPAGTRFVGCGHDQIVEWALGDSRPVERGRWSIHASLCSYAGDALVAGNDEGLYRLVPGVEPRRIADDWMLGVHAASERELYVAPGVGALWRITEHAVTHLGASERFLSIDVVGDRLAAITQQGRLVVWDLAPLRPLTLPIDAMPDHVLVDDAVWWNAGDHIHRMAIATGAIASFEERRPICFGDAFDILQPYPPRPEYQLEHLDLSSMKRTPLPGIITGVLCSRLGDRFITQSVERRRITVFDTARPDREVAVFDLATPPERATIEGRWLVVVDDKHVLERIDVATGARTRVALDGNPDGILVDTAGRIAIARDDILRRWDGGALSPPIAMPGTTTALQWNPAGIAGTTADRTVFVIDERDRVRTYFGGPGFVPGIARDAPFATLPRASDGGADVIDLRTGARWQLPGRVQFAALDARATRVAISRLPLGSGTIEIHPRLDDAATRAWLAGATNGKVDPGSTRVVFPD